VASRLINVRLDEARLRKLRTLRDGGVTISEVVREAIDARYERLRGARQPLDVPAIIRGLFEQYPDPPDLAPREYDVHDRHEARRAVLRRLASARKGKRR